MPLKVEGHTVPHLKAPDCSKLVSRGLRNDSIFSLCPGLVKSLYSLHKMGLGRFVSLSTVPTQLLEFPQGRLKKITGS